METLVGEAKTYFRECQYRVITSNKYCINIYLINN
jgi:hypothetical protein